MALSRGIKRTALDHDALRAYYENLPREYDYSSKCKMVVPNDLLGKSVLDVNCRRGKGVVKLANLVGVTGRTVGTDSSAAFIQDAEAFADESAARSTFNRDEVRFVVAFPEDLASAGLEESSFDVVFANSSVNVGYDPVLILEEIHRVLRPGGLLVLDGVVAEGVRDKRVVDQSRAIGNVVQAAPSRSDLEECMRRIGFGSFAYFEESPLCANEGYRDDCKVPVVESNESIAFTKTTMHARKAR